MGRYLSIASGGKTIHLKTGATFTCDSGSTLTLSGTVSGVTLAAPASLTVVGISSFGSGAQTTISAAGVYASTAALSCGVATVTSLVIGAGAGTITDGTATLVLTEDNISLVGASAVTGALDVSGAFTVATNKLAVAAATGIMTLENAATIGNHSAGTLALTATTVAVTGILTVSGASTHTGTVTMSGAASVGTTLTVTGLLTLSAGLTLGTGAVTWDTGTTNYCVPATFNGSAVTWTNAQAPAFVTAHPYIKVLVGGVTKRIPIFADA